MKTFLPIIFLFLGLQMLQAQGANDWIWYEDDIFDTYTYDAKEDTDGNIWSITGTQLVKYDGSVWTSSDVLDAGFSVDYLFSFQFADNGNIWTHSRYSIFEYIIATDTWVEHDPNGTAINPSGFRIQIDENGHVWWVARSGLYKYDGTDWTRFNFQNQVQGIEDGTSSSLTIANSGDMWVTTPYSTCIDAPCYTPAGIIHFDGTDTTYFLSTDIGVPEAVNINLVENEAGNILAVVTDSFQINNNQLLEYANGAWTLVENIPFHGYVSSMDIGEGDKLYLALRDHLLVGKDGVWDVIPYDSAHITRLFSFELLEDGGIYFSGRKENTPIGHRGVIGYLPPLEFAIRGALYIDKNGNGSFDGIDRGLKNQFVKTANNDRISFSNNNGDYSLLFREEGTYDIEALLPQYFFYQNPNDGLATVSLTNTLPEVNDIDFGFKPDTTAIDLSIAHTNQSRPNPGFNFCYSININNLAPKVTSGEVLFSFDPLLSFVSSSVTPNWINPDEISYDINDLNWLENRQIQLCFSIPPDGGLIGYTLNSNITVIPTTGADLDQSNNSNNHEVIISGPYDPNYISVDPVGIGPDGEIPLATRDLLYTIHFQNIGSDTARNVVIDNLLDLDLDLFSLKVIGSSHNYELDYLDETRSLRWTFSNINLVDSMTNELGSNGYVQYRIDIGNNLEGTVLNNSANIYFDFNDAIATNTTINTLADISTIVADLIPNPNCQFGLVNALDYLQLNLNTTAGGTAYVYDISGRLMEQHRFVGAQTGIDVSGFALGAYVIVVDLESCGLMDGRVFVRK